MVKEKNIEVLTATAAELAQYLTEGSITSQTLVQRYLDQIRSHNHEGMELNALISVAPLDQLQARATTLDHERASGMIRSRLHGIPIIIKDNIMTENSLGMDTTCGSYALKGAKVKKNAPIVDLVLEAGMIILGKANLSEWAGKKGYWIRGGWSAVGGQVQSPYVVGGFQKDDKIFGHSGPCGSSSGSAVGVAAGFAPLALGTETDGSITQPAGRASLYGLKVTVGSVSTEGTSPYSQVSDSLGPMAKTPLDLALLLGVIMKADFTSDLSYSWHGQKVAFVDPALWELSPLVAIPNPKLLRKQRAEINAAANTIEAAGARVVREVAVPQYTAMEFEGQDALEQVWNHDFRRNMADFLQGYTDAPVRSLEDIVSFNLEHAELEMPPDQQHPQNQLTDALEDQMSDEKYEEAKAFLRETTFTNGFGKIFVEHDADVVVGPLDSRIVSVAAAAGLPCGVVPLGYADELNGRAYGMTIVAGAGHEGKMLHFMSAWEAINPRLRVPPPQLAH